MITITDPIVPTDPDTAILRIGRNMDIRILHRAPFPMPSGLHRQDTRIRRHGPVL